MENDNPPKTTQKTNGLSIEEDEIEEYEEHDNISYSVKIINVYNDSNRMALDFKSNYPGIMSCEVYSSARGGLVENYYDEFDFYPYEINSVLTSLELGDLINKQSNFSIILSVRVRCKDPVSLSSVNSNIKYFRLDHENGSIVNEIDLGKNRGYRTILGKKTLDNNLSSNDHDSSFVDVTMEKVSDSPYDHPSNFNEEDDIPHDDRGGDNQ